MLKLVIVSGNTKLFSEILLKSVDKHSTNFVSFGGHFVMFTANFPDGVCGNFQNFYLNLLSHAQVDNDGSKNQEKRYNQKQEC